MRASGLWTAALLLATFPGLAPAGDADAEMRALVDKAIKAAGGEAQVAKLQAVRWKTRVSTAGAQKFVFSDESTARGFDQYRAEIEIQENDKVVKATLVVNKDQAWMRVPGKTLDARGPYINVRKDLYYTVRLPELLLPLKERGCKLSPLGEVKVGERTAVGMRAARQGHPDVNIYFDKTTGLLVRSEARIKNSTGQEVVVDFTMSGHKDFGGIRHFTRVALKVDDVPYGEAELSDIRPLGEVPESTFTRPE